MFWKVGVHVKRNSEDQVVISFHKKAMMAITQREH